MGTDMLFKDFLNFSFYKIYQWQKKVNEDICEYSTIMFMSLIFGLIILTLLLNFTNITGIFINIKLSRSIFAIVMMFVTISPLYFIFLYKKKYIKILNYFENKSIQYKKKMTFILYSFIVLCVIIFMSSAYIYVM
jgi:hypothetical protein